MNTGRLYINVNSFTNFKFTAKGVFSTTTGGDHGTMTVRFLDSNSNVQQTQLFSLTGTATDYSIIYSNATPITRIDMMCSEFFAGTTTFIITGGTQVLNYGSIYWKGWVKPENITRPFITKNYLFQLNAVDGLADLKDINFPISGVTGYATAISIIKTCLKQNGIPLPIKTQVNIIENQQMTTGQTLFNVVQANTDRFTDSTDGRLKTISCYDALDYLLKPFNCYIAQVDGCWQILAQHEISSYRTTFDYFFSNYTRSNYSRAIDITSSQFLLDSDELSKVPPYSETESTYRNHQSDTTNAIANGTFNSNITGWVNGTDPQDWSTFSWSSFGGGTLHTAAEDEDSNMVHYFKSSTFSLTKTGDEDKISFSVDITFDNDPFGPPPPDIIHPTKRNPTLRFVLINPTGGTSEDNEQRLKDGFQTYISQATFKITTSGNYTLKVYINPDDTSTYTAYDLYFDNIKGLVSTGSTQSYDHFYQGSIPNSTAVNVGEYELFFGDGIQNNEVGNLFITGLTKNWATDSTVDENLLLQQLFNKLKLTGSASFKNYLRFSIRDYGKVKFNSVVQINSKPYNICDYTYDLINNRLDLQIVEILTTAPTITYTDSQLSTVDGK